MKHFNIIDVQRTKRDILAFCEYLRFLFILILLQVALNFLVVCLLFRIVDSELTHEVVAWIPVPALSLHVEIFATLTGEALVHQVSISKQDQTITERECLRARLVNCAHNSFVSLASQLLKRPDDFHSCKAIEAGGRLVEQNDMRIRDHLYPDSCSFTLTTRYELFQGRSNYRISALFEPQVLYQTLYPLFSLCLAAA